MYRLIPSFSLSLLPILSMGDINVFDVTGSDCVFCNISFIYLELQQMRTITQRGEIRALSLCQKTKQLNTTSTSLKLIK